MNKRRWKDFETISHLVKPFDTRDKDNLIEVPVKIHKRVFDFFNTIPDKDKVKRIIEGIVERVFIEGMLSINLQLCFDMDASELLLFIKKYKKDEFKIDPEIKREITDIVENCKPREDNNDE